MVIEELHAPYNVRRYPFIKKVLQNLRRIGRMAKRQSPSRGTFPQSLLVASSQHSTGVHMAVRGLELEQVEEILGRALIDPEFRGRLINDTENTLKLLGYGGLSQDAVAFFKGLGTNAFSAAAAEVENRLGGRKVVGLWL
jgi:hypothetical protein